MFGAMHFIYYIKKINSHESRFNLFGILTISTQRIYPVVIGGREPVTFSSLVGRFPTTPLVDDIWLIFMVTQNSKITILIC